VLLGRTVPPALGSALSVLLERISLRLASLPVFHVLVECGSSAPGRLPVKHAALAGRALRSAEASDVVFAAQDFILWGTRVDVPPARVVLPTSISARLRQLRVLRAPVAHTRLEERLPVTCAGLARQAILAAQDATIVFPERLVLLPRTHNAEIAGLVTIRARKTRFYAFRVDRVPFRVALRTLDAQLVVMATSQSAGATRSAVLALLATTALLPMMSAFLVDLGNTATPEAQVALVAPLVDMVLVWLTHTALHVLLVSLKVVLVPLTVPSVDWDTTRPPQGWGAV